MSHDQSHDQSHDHARFKMYLGVGNDINGGILVLAGVKVRAIVWELKVFYH